MSKSANPANPERVTEEFVLEGADDLDDAVELVDDVDLSAIFEYGTGSVYRFDRDLTRDVPARQSNGSTPRGRRP